MERDLSRVQVGLPEEEVCELCDAEEARVMGAECLSSVKGGKELRM